MKDKLIMGTHVEAEGVTNIQPLEILPLNIIVANRSENKYRLEIFGDYRDIDELTFKLTLIEPERVKQSKERILELLSERFKEKSYLGGWYDIEGEYEYYIEEIRERNRC